MRQLFIQGILENQTQNTFTGQWLGESSTKRKQPGSNSGESTAGRPTNSNKECLQGWFAGLVYRAD